MPATWIRSFSKGVLLAVTVTLAAAPLGRSGRAVAAAAAPVAAAAAVAATNGDGHHRPAVHPIYAHVQDAPENDLAMQRFSAATRRFGLGPVEIVDIEGDPAPAPGEKLRAGIELVRKLDFGPGRAALDEVAAEVASTGGGGLDVAALSELFVYRAWAVGRFTFNREHVPVPTARAAAFAELVRAAMLTASRQFNPQQFPPLLLEDWPRAVADVAARPQGTLVVRAAPEALVTCDGGAPVPGPATFVGLALGEHVIHVQEPGWAAWGATIVINAPALEIQLPPRRMLTLDDAAAAARARRMGTAFALVAEPRPGQSGGLSLTLRLVDAAGVRHDAVIQPLTGDPAGLDAAVMRLDEQARRLDQSGPGLATAPPPADASLPPPVLMSSPPGPARLSEDPAAWARDHWPVLTAVGVMLGAVVVLSLTVH